MKKTVGVLLIVMLLVFTASVALAWHAPVEGMPQGFQQGDLRGYFIWHDGNGMHLRVHTEMFAVNFSGTIKTDGVFVDVHGNKLEQGDHYWLDGDKKTIHFKFTAAGGVDGLNFKVWGGQHLRFNLAVNGMDAKPMQIHLGHEGWHPGTNHFTIWR